MWKMGAKYNADKIGDRTEPYSTPMSILKKREEKLFHKYWVFFLTR